MCSGRFRKPQFPNRLDSRRLPCCDRDRPLMNPEIEAFQGAAHNGMYVRRSYPQKQSRRAGGEHGTTG